MVSRSYSQTGIVTAPVPTGATIWSAIRRPSGEILGSRKPRRSWVSGVAFPSRSTQTSERLVGGITLQIGKSARGGDAESGLSCTPRPGRNEAPGGSAGNTSSTTGRSSPRLRDSPDRRASPRACFLGYRLNVRLACNGAAYLLGSKPVAHLSKPTGPRCANCRNHPRCRPRTRDGLRRGAPPVNDKDLSASSSREIKISGLPPVAGTR